jgi:N-hydroxyarylamine O-acetyltransferase
VPFSADAYFARIGWSGPRTPTFDTLTSLLRAHMTRIPFENLDVLLGRGVRIDLDSVAAKLVDLRRGGYCFEHATLFRAAIEHAGFRPVAHAGRVVMVTPRQSAPRTHMFLTVVVDDGTYVVDPGFGGQAPLVPVPLVENREVQDGLDVHRMTRRDGEWLLEAKVNGAMTPLWTSTLEAEHPIDFAMGNHFTSTFPESGFVQRLMLSARQPGGRRVFVMNRDVTVANNGAIEKSQLADRAALRALLAEEFGIDLPEVERLRIPAIPEWT